MENNGTGSLLHPQIAKFYRINAAISDNGYIINYINEDCTFNWSNLEKLLLSGGEWSKDDPVYPKTYDEYFSYFQLLQPVLLQSEAAITKSITNRNDTDNTWFNKLQWLGHQTHMHTILQDHLHPLCETSTVENILFLTSILENAFANVYYTMTKKSPPHLLRDLLDTKELRDVFGICPILFLKIIMGSPNSVNLRNIIWHGFPLPSEVPSCYSATLLIVAASLSLLIQGKKIKLQSRPQITDFSRFVLKIKAASIDLTLLDDIPRMENAIESSKWTAYSEHKAFWYQILQHYQSECYWRFIILILPQIELILRRMYGEANDFDITAQLEQYYITLDTIFEIAGNPLLTECISGETLHLLYDIFISPYGMRIRDKTSHGEVDLNGIGKDLCSILLYAGLNLITSNTGYPLNDYKSRFHLNFLAYECINASKRCLLQVTTLKTPSSFGLEFNWDERSITALQQLKIIRPVKIFNRHKKEPEIVLILMKISQLIVQVCENYQISFAERFRMFLNRELRSRARKTLDRMVRTMKSIGVTLEEITHCIAVLNNLMQSNDHVWFEYKFEIIQRFCKQTLSVAENLVRYSDKENNEWLNAVDCCLRFQQISTYFKTVYR